MEVNPYKQLGLNIKVLRTRRELTQEQLAAKADVERSYMGSIERGERNISVVTLLRLAKALKCEPGELLADVKVPARRNSKSK